MIKTLQPGFRPWVNRPTALRAMEIPPCPLRGTSPAVRLVNQKEGPFMGRLRAYFDQLAHPMQDVHSGEQPVLTVESHMRRLPFRALLSHRSAGGRWCRKAPKGGKPPEVAGRSNAFHNV